MDNNYYKKINPKSLQNIVYTMKHFSLINQKNNSGNTPLFSTMYMMYAAHFLKDFNKLHFLKDMTRELLENKANPNLADNTGSVPLHLAAIVGDKNHSELLFKCGANPNIANNKGDTPLSTIIKRFSQDSHNLKIIPDYLSLINQMIVHGAQMQYHDIQEFNKTRSFCELSNAIKPHDKIFTKLLNHVTLNKWLQDNSKYNFRIKPQHIVSRFKDSSLNSFSKNI